MVVYRRVPFRRRSQVRRPWSTPGLFKNTRSLIDTGLSISDVLVLTARPALSDTALSIVDSLAVAHSLALTDTGLTVTDSLSRTSIIALSDTGLSISDVLISSRTRMLADTGLTVSDSLAISRTRVLSDTGLAVSDSLVTYRARSLADTGLSVADVLVSTGIRVLGDTGLSISDSLSTERIRSLSDAGLAIGDSVVVAATVSLGPPVPIVGRGIVAVPILVVRGAHPGRLIGKTTRGAFGFDLAADTKRVANFVAGRDCRLVKVTAFVDGLGSGAGSQVARAVVYDAGGSLLAISDEVLVLDGQGGAWVDFALSAYPGGVKIARGNGVSLGLLGGANANSIRVFGDSTGPLSGEWNADTYSDGASDPFGGSTSLDSDMSVFATTTNYAQLVPKETDFYYARLPFWRAQEELNTGKVFADSLQIAECGWHGTSLDRERGSFVVVNENGPLTDLVGERLKVTVGRGGLTPSSVIAYCHTRASLVGDLSLTRRLFLALDTPSDDAVEAEVEVVA